MNNHNHIRIVNDIATLSCVLFFEAFKDRTL